MTHFKTIYSGMNEKLYPTTEGEDMGVFWIFANVFCNPYYIVASVSGYVLYYEVEGLYALEPV